MDSQKSGGTIRFAVSFTSPLKDALPPFGEPEGVTMTPPKHTAHLHADVPPEHSFVVTMAANMALRKVSSWLYDKIINKDSGKSPKNVKINRKKITYANRDEFIQLVEEEITSQSGGD